MTGRERSRSPPPGSIAHSPSSRDADVTACHSLRELYHAPCQSKFRVGALLRFVRPDGTEGTIGAVNAEPHDANIRGAICAERAALCRFQHEEAGRGARIVRVVCVTDAPEPIFPGPLCREFLTSVCDPTVEIAASGAKEPTKALFEPLEELLPLPSVYRRKDQDAARTMGEALSGKVKAPDDGDLAEAYLAAGAKARCQTKQSSVYPVVFGAAVKLSDGRVHSVAELKGIEYGCTVDAVSLLLPEMQSARDKGIQAVCLIQVDQYGVAHAPFAAARSLMIEHGFGQVRVSAHRDDGSWAPVIVAQDILPHANFVEIF